MRVRVHTSAYTVHRVAIAGKLWFTRKSRSKISFHNVNSLWVGVTVLTAGLECRVPGVSDLVLEEGRSLHAGKLWFVTDGRLKSGQNMGKS